MPRGSSAAQFLKLPARWDSDPGILKVSLAARAAFLHLWTLVAGSGGDGVLTVDQVRSVFPAKVPWRPMIEQLVDAGLLLHDDSTVERWCITRRSEWRLTAPTYPEHVRDTPAKKQGTYPQHVSDMSPTYPEHIPNMSKTYPQHVQDRDPKPAGQSNLEVQKRTPRERDREIEKYPPPSGGGAGTSSARSAPRAARRAATRPAQGRAEPGCAPADKVVDDPDDYAPIPDDLKDVRGPELARQMLARALENNKLYTGVRPKGFAPKRLNPMVTQNSPDNFTPVKGKTL